MRLLLFCLMASNAIAQTSSAALTKIIDSQFSLRQYRHVAISPDARHVAWVEAIPNPDGSESQNSAIYILDLTLPAAQPRRLSPDGKSPHAEHSPAWSPDSSQLAFLSDQGSPADKRQLELFVTGVVKTAPHKLTKLTGFLATPRWSPDGRVIALLFTENAPRAAGPLEPSTRESGVIEDHIYEQRVTLVDIATAHPRTITAPNLYVYEYDWSPDSRQIAYTAAKGNGDNNWWIAKLHAIDVATGASRVIFDKPETQLAVPRYSPDGRSIAFIQGLMSDEGATGGDIYLLPVAGGAEPKNLTLGRKTSPAYLHWQASGKLLFTERVDGGSAVSLLNTTSGETETLWKGDESIRASGDDLSISVASDGRTSAMVRSSWSRPPEVWAGPVGDWQPRTRANEGRAPAWGQSKSIHWTQDGADVQGWLLYPSAFDASRKYPMVVSVHGGPASAKSPSWPVTGYELLASQGFFVFFPNPRGSYGKGETFTRANVRDFGYGDLHDIEAGVDAVVREAPVDATRVGIGGWSYGGFMTMFAVTQTTRFRAAVAGAGISNWQSYYGENLIDQWMIPYFGASVYDDPAAYAKSSPIQFIKNVKTPTLILVGDSDAECPTPQSYEFWHALKTLGVETQFVVYPNEGHSFHDPEHQRDVIRRAAAWFTAHL